MQGHLLIPDYDLSDLKPYPGNIEPGFYSCNGVVELLRRHAEDPEAIRFIADMMEE